MCSTSNDNLTNIHIGVKSVENNPIPVQKLLIVMKKKRML
jgi:hypothetical protein